MGTFSLVPEVVELAQAYDKPVLAAGGVTHGRHMAAALALGADGVWTGTIWQATHESDTPMKKKQRLIEGRGQDAWISTAYDGKRVRAMRSLFQEIWEREDAPEILPMPLQGMLVGKIETAIEDHQLDDWLHVTAGQGLTFIEEVKPARQVVFDLADQAARRPRAPRRLRRRVADSALAGNASPLTREPPSRAALVVLSRAEGRR